MNSPKSRNNTPLEAEESETLMAYLRQRDIRFTHVKNETGRADSSGKIRNWKAIFDKQDGVSPGFPDFVIVIPYVGLLCIELKRVQGSKTSHEQIEWVGALNTVPGVEAHVCYGAIQAIKLIEEISPSAVGKALLAAV